MHLHGMLGSWIAHIFELIISIPFSKNLGFYKVFSRLSKWKENVQRILVLGLNVEKRQLREKDPSAKSPRNIGKTFIAKELLNLPSSYTAAFCNENFFSKKISGRLYTTKQKSEMLHLGLEMPV